MVRGPDVWFIGSPLTEAFHDRDDEIARHALIHDRVASSTPATTSPAQKDKDTPMVSTQPRPDTAPAVNPVIATLQQAHNSLAAQVQRLSTELSELNEVVLGLIDDVEKLRDRVEELSQPKAKTRDNTNDRIIGYLRDAVPGVWMNCSSVAANLDLDLKAVAGRLDRMNRDGKVERKGGKGTGAHPLYRVVPPPRPQQPED